MDMEMGVENVIAMARARQHTTPAGERVPAPQERGSRPPPFQSRCPRRCRARHHCHCSLLQRKIRPARLSLHLRPHQPQPRRMTALAPATNTREGEGRREKEREGEGRTCSAVHGVSKVDPAREASTQSAERYLPSVLCLSPPCSLLPAPCNAPPRPVPPALDHGTLTPPPRVATAAWQGASCSSDSDSDSGGEVAPG